MATANASALATSRVEIRGTQVRLVGMFRDETVETATPPILEGDGVVDVGGKRHKLPRAIPASRVYYAVHS